MRLDQRVYENDNNSAMSVNTFDSTKVYFWPILLANN